MKVAHHLRKSFQQPPCYGLGTVLMMAACRLREGGVPSFAHCGSLNWFAADKTRACNDLFGCYVPAPNVTDARLRGVLPGNHSKDRNSVAWTASAARLMLDGAAPAPAAEPCVAVHVRRGDACANRDRRCFSDEEYARAARELLTRGDEYVLIVGDDDVAHLTTLFDVEVRSRARRVLPRADARNLTIDKMRSRKILIEQNIGRLGDDPVATLLADVRDARRCRAIVGSFKAGVTKLIYSLMTADRGKAPPYRALDGRPGDITRNVATCFIY
tara:strand:- start:2323 stop:3138 length:816 start_codon:yes stop_codon:yes gene_type:complete